MRRTYKSKKDTTSVIERRDLFQNLDEKSAAYNAFSIQNIKQTKRELSCVGSSNPLGVAFSKVRKKKFVKRIVKEAEIPCRENTSGSAYLTPDKSIRVNKPLDPFDLLLMSSPAGPVNTAVKEVESVTSKVNLFDQLVSKKEGRAYTRRKQKAKKINYSSAESYDSGRENSADIQNTENTSDIRTHDLLVEKVDNNKPEITDDSINNIVNNLSILNKLKHKYSSNDSVNKSLILNRHRLTRNILSPLSQKSPLCSTPFKVKYRGDSIFKFSPITASKKVNSPKHAPLTEDNDDSNCSLVLLSSVKVGSPNIIEEKALNLSPNNSIKREESSHLDHEIETYIEAETSSHRVKEVPNLVTNVISSFEINSLQTTELEPFLGFSNDANSENVAEDENQVISFHELEDNILKSDIIDSEAIVNDICLEEKDDSVDCATGEIEIAGNIYCYEYNLSNNDNIVKSDAIDTEGIGNDVCLEEENGTGDCGISDIGITENIHCYEYNLSNITVNTEDNNDDSSSIQSTDEDKGSLYDTCTSEQSSILGRIVKKEPLVLLQRMNDSLFFKYYDEMKYRETCNDDTDSSSINTESGSFEDCNDLKISSSSSSHIGSSTEDNILENKTEYNSDEIESNDDEELSSNNEEEKCISFVTTRRRNEVTNNSMMSMFNDSNCSSSTNCDNTVLSNYMEMHKPDAYTTLDNNEIETNDEKSENDKYSEHSDEATDEQESRISFVTTRNSNITDRKSAIRSRKSSLKPRSGTVSIGQSNLLRESIMEESRMSCFDGKPGIVLQPGKKWERSLSIYRRMTMMTDQFDRSILEDESNEAKGRKYRQSVISTMEMQEFNSSLHNESINSRRSTFVSKPSRSTIRIVKQDPNSSRLSLCNTTLLEDLKGFWNEECDDTIIELSKLSITDHTHEVTVLDNFHDTSNRIATAKDYVLRRCNQTEPTLFDECYPDLLLKNCHKIGEGVYGEVYLWRDRDGRARVLKIIPIAGNIKVNGESQKDFHEIISEIVIAMELSALRAPIAEIERHFDEGKDVEALDLHSIENATDVFNEVLAVRCVYGSYPSRLLDLWDLYDESTGSENDNPAILPVDQQYIVLELANAGQDLESYQFNNAEQAHALFLQVAYGLAVAEEAFQFEHRDLHWGNVLIAPTEQKFATFVIRGRSVRVARGGVRATVIDYSLSRVALRLGADEAALYNDLGTDESLFDAVGDYQFQVYRLMREKLGNDWKNFEPYTNILWLHYTVDKMITALRYKRTNTKIHKHYIDKLKGIKGRILDYGSAAQFVLTDNEI